MPFASKAQQRWAFSKEGLGKKKAMEFSDATNYDALPEHVRKKARMSSLASLAGMR